MNANAYMEVDAKPGPRVLIVENDEAALAVLGRFFIGSGIKAETFTSAQAVLETCDPGTAAVLLLGTQAQSAAGYEFDPTIDAVQNSAPTVFLTGRADFPVAVAVATPASNGLRPSNRDDVVDCVREAFCRLVVSFPSNRQAPGYAERLNTLTSRERQVYDIMVTGLTSKRIAREIGCSFRTIEIHRAHIMTKMAASSLARLVGMSFENG